MVNNFNNKYSHSTLSKFDIIGSYFVNLYYNEFYIKAKNLKTQGSYNNITDSYKNILSSYVDFSTQQDFFKQIVKGIHTYCISTTRHTTMSHKECIDFMVSEFVPNNLWNSLRENQKNKLFHESLISCIKIFTENIISNKLHIIIDNHDQPENITILQDLFLTIILLEKDKIFSKFINPGDSTGLDLFKKKLQKIIDDKKKLIDINKGLNEKINVLETLNKKNSNIILELQKNNKLLLSECNKLSHINQEYKINEKKLHKRIYQYTNIIKEYNELKLNNYSKNTNNNTNYSKNTNNKNIQKQNTNNKKQIYSINYNSDDNLNNELDNKLNNELNNKLNNELDNKLDNKLNNKLNNELNNKLENKLENELENEFEIRSTNSENNSENEFEIRSTNSENNSENNFDTTFDTKSENNYNNNDELDNIIQKKNIKNNSKFSNVIGKLIFEDDESESSYY